MVSPPKTKAGRTHSTPPSSGTPNVLNSLSKGCLHLPVDVPLRRSGGGLPHGPSRRSEAAIQTVLERADCKNAPLPRSAPHLRHSLPGTRHGRQDPFDDHRPCVQQHHAEHLRPCHRRDAQDCRRQNRSWGSGKVRSVQRSRRFIPSQASPLRLPALQGPETKGRSKLCQPDQGSFIGGVLLPIVNGKHMAWNVYAKAEEKCEEKLAELITEIKQEIAIQKEAATLQRNGAPGCLRPGALICSVCGLFCGQSVDRLSLRI